MWPNPQEPGDLVTFSEEILNEKLHFLCSEYYGDSLPNYIGNITLHQQRCTTFIRIWIVVI